MNAVFHTHCFKPPKAQAVVELLNAQAKGLTTVLCCAQVETLLERDGGSSEPPSTEGATRSALAPVVSKPGESLR